MQDSSSYKQGCKKERKDKTGTRLYLIKKESDG